MLFQYCYLLRIEGIKVGWVKIFLKILDGMICLAIKLLIKNRICPTVFVIGNKSVNRIKKSIRNWYVVAADVP